MTKEALDVMTKFERKYKDLTVMRIAKYDKTRYLVLAQEDPNVANRNGGWYGLDMTSGLVYSYSPVMEIKKFNEIVSNNTIYKR